MLERLKAIQSTEHLSDGAMAARLGISRSAWNLIRRGKMDLSDTVAVTAAGVWPALFGELLRRAESAADSLTDGTTSARSGKGAA